MSDDIVARLRVLNHHAKKLAENESLNDMYCYAFLRFESLTMEASSEIGILRIHFDMLLTDLRRAMQERDEARRWVCQLLESPESVMHLAKPGNGTKRDFAAEQGWDCFKEAGDEP